MPRKQRNHAQEYARRIQRATAKGLSRSQARGHARAGEAPIRAKPSKSDARLETALTLLRETGNQGRAAKEAGVSAERFRNFLRSHALAHRKGKLWHFTDNRPREMKVITGGEVVRLILPDFEQASLNGSHLTAVKAYVNSNNADLLRSFHGKSVIDITGQAHPLETHPNTLHRLVNTETDLFHDIYRLVQ